MKIVGNDLKNCILIIIIKLIMCISYVLLELYLFIYVILEGIKALNDLIVYD